MRSAEVVYFTAEGSGLEPLSSVMSSGREQAGGQAGTLAARQYPFSLQGFRRASRALRWLLCSLSLDNPAGPGSPRLWFVHRFSSFCLQLTTGKSNSHLATLERLCPAGWPAGRSDDRATRFASKVSNVPPLPHLPLSARPRPSLQCLVYNLRARELFPLTLIK